MDEPPDLDVSPLADARPAESRPGPRGRRSTTLQSRRSRLALTTLVLVGALACLLGQVAPDAWQRASTALFPPSRTATPTATPVIPTPLPAAGILAPPPTDCPASPPLDSITAQPENFSVPVTMYGRSPVWVPEGYMPQGIIPIYEPSTPAPYPGLKIIWEVGPTAYPRVTVRASDLRTGELAWWSGGSPRPQAPILTLDPRDVSAGSSTPFYQEHLYNLIVTHAGCYKLDVMWQGGGWSTIFAVGGRTSP